jgi:hypothetical protein
MTDFQPTAALFPGKELALRIEYRKVAVDVTNMKSVTGGVLLNEKKLCQWWGSNSIIPVRKSFGNQGSVIFRSFKKMLNFYAESYMMRSFKKHVTVINS